MKIDKESLNLADTLFCGQAFRWNARIDEHNKKKKKGNETKNIEENDRIVLKGERQEKGRGGCNSGTITYTGVVGSKNAQVVQLKEKTCENSFEPISTGNFDFQSYFGMDDDLTDICSNISMDKHMDKHMKNAINSFKGMRILRQEPFETLISYIISAASNIPRIRKTIALISKYCGNTINFNGKKFHSFPNPEKLSRTSINDLKKLGLGFRAKYVKEAAGNISRGDLCLSDLKVMSYQKAKEELIKLPGVGDKISDCVLLFSLNKTEAFPVDRWVRKAVRNLYFNGKNLSLRDIHKFAKSKFGKNAGYAQQYLFHYYRQLNNYK